MFLRSSLIRSLAILPTVSAFESERFRKVIASGLKRRFDTSIDLRITSSGRLFSETKRRRAPRGTSVFDGILPFGVNTIVINGFGFLRMWCSQVYVSLS